MIVTKYSPLAPIEELFLPQFVSTKLLPSREKISVQHFWLKPLVSVFKVRVAANNRRQAEQRVGDRRK